MTGPVVLRAATVVVPDGIGPRWLTVHGGRITEVGSGAPPASGSTVDLAGRTVVPGFVDLHAHGGAGHDYSEGTAEAVRTAAGHHRARGTTTMLASLVALAPERLSRLVGLLAELTEDGVIAGSHVEGPWLSAGRPGAHDPELLRDPEPDELERVLAAGRGTVRMVTIAPERPGGLEAIRRLAARGVVAAVGHTDADYELTRVAIEAGARVGTHLFNAMAPIHHRAPGPAVALLEDPRVTVELISDGVHVHPALFRRVLSDVGAGRIALVTDAMAASGCQDGRYRLGGIEVTVHEGVATVTGSARGTGSATIAGGTATMAELFALAVRTSNLPAPAALRTAVELTATTPASVLGRTDIGALRAGCWADLVVLDGDLKPVAVMHRGEWVSGSGSAIRPQV
jgi:N-acetylglucosamine-6-phosphate deacetylase